MSAKTRNAGYIMGVNERAFLRMTLRHMRDGGLVINVGANVGYTMLYLATAAMQRNEHEYQFVGLEPEPRTFEMLKENVALNPLQVAIQCLAAGDSDGSAVLHSAGEGDGAASLEKRRAISTDAFEVEVRRLDGLDLRTSGQNVSGLVIDVEGHAGAVLRGAECMLQRDRPFVAAEIHNEDEVREIETSLNALGYQLADATAGLWGSHRMWTCQTAREL